MSAPGDYDAGVRDGLLRAAEMAGERKFQVSYTGAAVHLGALEIALRRQAEAAQTARVRGRAASIAVCAYCHAVMLQRADGHDLMCPNHCAEYPAATPQLAPDAPAPPTMQPSTPEPHGRLCCHKTRLKDAPCPIGWDCLHDKKTGMDAAAAVKPDQRAASGLPKAGNGPMPGEVRWLPTAELDFASGKRPPNMLQQAWTNAAGQVEWRDVPVVEG